MAILKNLTGQLGFRLAFIVLALGGCGGGGSNTGNNNNNAGNNATTMTLVASYDVPEQFQPGNYVLDNDKLIMAGGLKGIPTGAQHDGHPAFSNSVYAIDLAAGTKATYTVAANTGHVFGTGTVATGIGNSARVKKISNSKYFIYGGFQYNIDTFILDTANSTISNYKTDAIPLNTTPPTSIGYFANGQGNVVLNNGDIVFFGFNSGLYGEAGILLFNSQTSAYRLSNAVLTMPRSHTDTYKLLDGRVLLVGGWDMSALVGPGSATRRVEIYTPATDTITRVADIPAPTSYQHVTEDIVTANEVCVNDYKYNIAGDTWALGCNISTSVNNQSPNVMYDVPMGSNAVFIGKMSNGHSVFIEKQYTTLPFSDVCACAPYASGSKIKIFKTN